MLLTRTAAISLSFCIATVATGLEVALAADLQDYAERALLQYKDTERSGARTIPANI